MVQDKQPFYLMSVSLTNRLSKSKQFRHCQERYQHTTISQRNFAQLVEKRTQDKQISYATPTYHIFNYMHGF